MKNSQKCAPARQSSAYKPSRKHEVNLRRNPLLHFQIGLILALLAAIFFIEMRMPEKAMVPPEIDEDIEFVFTIGEVIPEPKKKILLKKTKTKPKELTPQIIDKVKKKKDETDFIETLLPRSEPSDQPVIVDPSTPVYDDYDDEEPVSVVFVERVPLFPGCEGLATNDERRACMSTKISKFVSRKFRTDKGEGLGLEGENQIFVVFDIDKQGDVVGVKARAPHKNLENEAIRVTKLLPKMTPGKQQGRNVNVRMALPIRFIIQD